MTRTTRHLPPPARRCARPRLPLGAASAAATFALLAGAATAAAPPAIPAKTLCARIPAASVSSIVGHHVMLLRAVRLGAADTCQFGVDDKDVSTQVVLGFNRHITVSARELAVTIQASYGGSYKPYSGLGGTSYSSLYVDAKITTYSMFTVRGTTEYTASLFTSSSPSLLARLVRLVIKAS